MKVTTLKNPNPTWDLMSRLSPEGRASENKRKMGQLKDLLERMLTTDPEKRISPKHALEHLFVTEPIAK
jgi:serine/threonine-protein kinase PRP4